MASAVRISDGSFSFEGGVDSGRTTTVQSEANPYGLPRNMLAWLDNGTVRGGGISPRFGWTALAKLSAGNSLFQGAFLYEPLGTDPQLFALIGGHLFQQLLEAPFTLTDLSEQFGLFMPASEPHAYFVQGEQFLVIQAGDYLTALVPTLPLFWDGTTLRRSNGLVNTTPTGTSYTVVPNASWVVPAAGSTVQVFNYANANNYPGALGDTGQWLSGSGFSSGTFTVTAINPSAVNYNVASQTNNFTVPVVGGTFVFNWGGVNYPGTNGDIGTLFSGGFVVGIFQVTAGAGTPNITLKTQAGSPNIGVHFNTVASPGAFYGNSSITLQTVSTNYAGGTITPGSYTFALTMAAGPVSELPAAGPMVYYQGRIWYAQGTQYIAGDIVRGPSGTSQYGFTDSILKVTENPLALGGDGFSIPTSAGNITALAYTSNQDSTLGQGPLYIFTRKQVFALTVPVTRTDWINSSASNLPVQTVAQLKFGSVGDRCVMHVNGDLFYQGLEPSIRSFFVSTRYFQQWGNVPLSRNINRALKFNNRALMPFATGINFDNRMLQGILPIQTPVGVAFQGLAALDFDIIGSFEQGGGALNPVPKPPPAWEGMLEGLDVLQLLEDDFGGLDRGFAVAVSRVDGSIQVWELTTENIENQISVTDPTQTSRTDWYLETPAYTWGKEFEQKELDGAEIWVDNVFGTVHMEFYYRPDATTCWQFWSEADFCSAKNSCEDVTNPICYPTEPLGPGEKFPIVLPTPPDPTCNAQDVRPNNIGYQFQMKIVIKGYCRIRGILLFALPRQKAPGDDLSC